MSPMIGKGGRERSGRHPWSPARQAPAASSGLRIAARGRRPSALLIVLTMAAVAGCATRSAEFRPPSGRSRSAPNLLEVDAVAPAINAGVGRSAAPKPLPPGPTRPPAASPKPAVDPEIKPAAAPEPEPKAPDPEATPGPLPAAVAALPPAGATPPTIPESAPPYPIDLASALRLADGQNPVIGEARVLILDALAQRTAARALLLPYLNAGLNYHDHTGPLQRSSGSILPLTEQSFYFGGGARTLAAESIAIPAVNIFAPLTEAIYEPLAAQQRVAGARLNASATANSVLLDVAGLYIELIGAEAVLAARRQTAVEADRIAESVASFAATGQGRRSDANRAEGDRRLFQADIQQAEEAIAVASARLAERLNLDPSSRLQPLAGPLEPIALIDPDAPVDDLIRSAVARRPDLAARDALAMQAQYQVNKEKARPFLPTIWLGFSGGSFGGGSNLVPPALAHFDGRTDFDVRAYWTLLNFGAGNASLIKQRKAQFNQALAERARVLNQIRAEVATARAESLALRSEVTVARRGLQTAEEGYRLDQDRLRETLGKPIEALDSLRLLSGSRVALIEAITRTNRSQFALFVSLGAPPPLGPPSSGAIGN